MPFRRYYVNERDESRMRREESPRPFTLSDSAVEVSIAGATIGFSLILVIVWLLNARFLVDQSDIQTAVQISAGLGALSLAVPLFLRDFRVQDTLWRSFIIISAIFLISTCIGFITFLLQSDPEEAMLTLAGFTTIIAVSNVRTAMALRRLQRYHKNKAQYPQNLTIDQISVRISPTKPSEFIIVMILALICIFTSNGLPSAFLLLFSYGLMLLLATLSASVISVFTHHNVRTSTEEAKHRLKTAIQRVLEENPHKAFTEQELLDSLREGPYRGYSELISRSAMQIAVSEMDIEDREAEPKITIWKDDKVIPRWKDDYDERVFKSAPSILVFRPDFDARKAPNLNNQLGDKGSKELLVVISEKSDLSIELLEDGNVLDRILSRFDGILPPYKDAKLAYVKKELTPFENSNFKGTDKEYIEFLNKLVMNLQKVTWYSSNVYRSYRDELLSSFTEEVLLERSGMKRLIIRDELKKIFSTAFNGTIEKGEFDNVTETIKEEFN